jgi:hypothetical protein
MKTHPYFLPLVLIASVLGGCASGVESGRAAGSPAYLEQEYTAFREGLRECTARTGYDPEQQQTLGPYDLGTGELAWRECAYSALLKVVIPNTAEPRLYHALIEKDKELTLGIQEKRVTREQRLAQISEQRQRIIDQETTGERMRTAMTDMEERRRQDLLVRSTHSLVMPLRVR